MKKSPASFHWLFGFALLAIAGTGCRTTPDSEGLQMCTVVGLMGDVRCWDGQSNKVHVVRRGDWIPAGWTIQTAKGAGNWIDLVTGEYHLSERPIEIPNAPPKRLWDSSTADYMRINESTILALSMVTSRGEGKNRVRFTRLRLLEGSVLIDTWRIPTTQAAKEEIRAPYLEIKGSNAVIRAESAIFFFSASGLTRVLTGSARVELIDLGRTKELSDSQAYDPKTGEISPIPNDLKYNIISSIFPDFGNFPQQTQWAPPFQVPKRPF